MDPSRVYLVQTDTTVGFVSQDKRRLNIIKGRNPSQPCLVCVPTCKELLLKARVPNKFKNRVRRAKKTTFLYPNHEAVRVVHEPIHRAFLEKLGWAYSTSANPTKEAFDIEYAKQKADEIIEDRRGFFEDKASALWKLGLKRARRLR
jgi:tRNA A37 threonylcarbamoyladenosine synthetase subunit TsaC/SUA5/YrdC